MGDLAPNGRQRFWLDAVGSRHTWLSACRLYADRMSENPAASPLEEGVVRVVLRLVVSLIPVPLLLLIDGDDLLMTVTAHLSVLVAAGIFATVSLGPLADSDWFTWTALRPSNRLRAGAAMLVVFVTGYAALITMASSAALRLDPSLQYLQLLSALDIAWAAAALYFGVRWLAGDRAALVAAAMLGSFCVWSIWNYLRIVGFDASGGWIVERDALVRYVLPYDMAAAVVAVAALWLGARRWARMSIAP